MANRRHPPRAPRDLPATVAGAAADRGLALSRAAAEPGPQEAQGQVQEQHPRVLWTLLNPALYLVVFSIVSQEVLRVQVPYYALFLLSGLLVWNLFSAAVGGGTGSVVDNASLVQKVWFPQEILPLASIGAALAHFGFQLSVLVGPLVIFGPRPGVGVPAGAPARPGRPARARRGARHRAVRGRRVPPRHAAPARARPARLVLAVGHRLPVPPAVGPAGRQGVRAANQPHHLDRRAVPAGHLQPRRRLGRPPRRRRRLVPAQRRARRVGSFLLLLAALWVFGRLEDNLAEEI
jgi:hypothetical protein